MASATAANERVPVRIPHAPGLDGLRGMAVAAVVVFHAGPLGWLPGGFLGVSLFFTLSGYLITTLVLAEVARDRGLGLASFWSRRVRRLLPALVAISLGLVISSHWIDWGEHLRADLLGGLTYSANWVQIARGQSYADLFVAPSPLTHLWSLAIEEQFYVVLPLVAWVLARRAPWLVRSNLAIGAALVVVAGVAYTQFADDPTVAYYGTLNRAPEIAIGVLLACRTRVSEERAPRWLTGVGIVGAIVTVIGWRMANVTDAWIAAGGLAAFAVASAALVRTASRPGPIASVLAFAPLRWLGLISYGLYLYHWPVVVWLSPGRVDWAPVPLFALRTVVAVAISAVSYLLIEQPIRRRRTDLPTRTVLLSGLGVLIATVAVVLLAVPPAKPTAAAKPAPAVVGADATAKPVAEGPPRVVLLGDSLPSWMVRDGGSALDPDEVTLVDATLEACDGAAGDIPARSRLGVEVPVPEGCTGWPRQYPPFFQSDADVAVLMVGGHAILDHQINGTWHGPCDAEAQDWYRNDIIGRLRYLESHADEVVLVLPAWADRLSQWINPADYLDRADCVRATMTEAAAAAGADTIDFGTYLCPDGRDHCRPVRTRDGVHLDEGAAPDALLWVLRNSVDAG